MQEHDHLCQVVADRSDLHAALGRFLESLGPFEGVFVHRYSEKEAWDLLEEAGRAKRLKEEGLLHVVTRQDAFEGGSPRISYDHVGATVSGLLAAAQAKGRGLAILADASHAYIQEGRATEWFNFEHWLGRRVGPAVRLVCLYWASDLEEPSHLDGMMKTHLARLDLGAPWSAGAAEAVGSS